MSNVFIIFLDHAPIVTPTDVNDNGLDVAIPSTLANESEAMDVQNEIEINSTQVAQSTVFTQSTQVAQSSTQVQRSKYYCSICNKDFRASANFSQHKKTIFHKRNEEAIRILYKVGNIDVRARDFNDLEGKKWTTGSILEAYLFSKRFDNTFLALGLKVKSLFDGQSEGHDYFNSINIHMHDFIIGCFLINGKLVLN